VANEASEKTIRVGGNEIRMVTAGSGRPLLILHDELGYTGLLEWQRALAKERTLLIPLAPGFGRSARVEWLQSARDLGGFYSRILRQEGLGDLDVIGFSFGGWVAAEMIAGNPNQFRRAVLVAPGGVRPTEGELMDAFQVPAQNYIDASVANPAATPEFGQLYGEPTPERYEALEDARAEFARLAWQPYFHNPSLPYLLEGISGEKILLLWGNKDRVVPRSAIDRYQKALAGAKLVVFENCGHRPEIEKTQQFVNEVKQFLAA
jgi:pimeloyl-ACP methyl ester carboxylesterase